MIGIWLILWQVIYLIVGKEVLVPSPFATFKTLINMMTTKVFYFHLFHTLIRIINGVGISLALAFLLALGSYYSRVLKAFLKPAMTFMKTTPVMAIIILALLWVKSDQVPILVCFLMCYPIIYTNIYTGLCNMDLEIKEMSKLFKVSLRQRLLKCYIPQLKPYIYAALDMGIGMAFKVVIAAEVLAVPRYSIGYQLLDAKIYLETEQVFAWIMAIIILSQFFSQLVGRVFKRGALK